MFFYWEEIRSFISHCDWIHTHLTLNNFSWFEVCPWALATSHLLCRSQDLSSQIHTQFEASSSCLLSPSFYPLCCPVPWAPYNEQSRNLMKLMRLLLGWRKGLEMRELVSLREANSSGVMKSIDSGVKPGFKSWFCHLLTMVSGTSL